MESVTRGKVFVTEKVGAMTIHVEKVVAVTGEWERRDKIGAGIAALLGVIFIILAALHAHNVNNEEKVEYMQDKCVDVGCLRSAINIQSKIDPNVEPCQSPIEHMCGKPKDTDHEMFTEIIRRNKAQLYAIILDNQHDGDLHDTITKLADFHKSCMRTFENNDAEVKFSKDISKDDSFWFLKETPSQINTQNRTMKYDWKKQHIQLIQHFGTDAFYRLRIDDSKLVISPPFNGYRGKLYRQHRFFSSVNQYFYWQIQQPNSTDAERSKKAYSEMVNSAMEELARDIDGKTAVDHYNKLMPGLSKNIQIVEQWTIDAMAQTPEQEEPESMTISKLQIAYPDVANWLNVFQIYNASTITNNTKVVVKKPSYFKELNTILNTEYEISHEREDTRDQINTYLVWKTLMSVMPYMPYAYTHLARKFIEDMGSRGRNSFPEAEWEDCMDIMERQLDVVMSAVFVSHNMNNYDKDEINSMIETLRYSYITKLKGKSLTKDFTKTKQTAMVKQLENLEIVVGQPKEWKDQDSIKRFLRDRNFTALLNTFTSGDFYSNYKRVFQFNRKLDANQLNDPQRYNLKKFKYQWAADMFTYNFKQSINIPSGFLQFPLYSKEQPHYINYGATAMWLSGKILQGLHLKSHAAHSRCIADEVHEAHKEDDNYYSINVDRMMWYYAHLEPLLAQSYNAYLNYTKTFNIQERRLPVVHADNNEQMFFMSFVQAFLCTSAHQDKYSKIMLTEMIRRSPVFNEAFSCSDSVSQSKCPSIW